MRTFVQTRLPGTMHAEEENLCKLQPSHGVIPGRGGPRTADWWVSNQEGNHYWGSSHSCRMNEPRWAVLLYDLLTSLYRTDIERYGYVKRLLKMYLCRVVDTAAQLEITIRWIVVRNKSALCLKAIIFKCFRIWRPNYVIDRRNGYLIFLQWPTLLFLLYICCNFV